MPATAFELLQRKQTSQQRISVVLPALNEAPTVGRIVAAVHRALVLDCPLVDELVVIDAGSTDATAAVAAAAGARVVAEADVLPHLGRVPGKGEALWKSLAVTDGDLVVFLDADLRGVGPDWVTRLLEPLLPELTVGSQDVQLVKAHYDRPLTDGALSSALGGGRVTELVARPLLNLHWPELADVVQPLAGEYAARRTLLERLPFTSGYGVELGLLIDTLRLCGRAAIAQVDLGRREHRHQSDAALGVMAAELWQTALLRLEREGRLVLTEPPRAVLRQFTRGNDAELRAHDHPVPVTERPPMITVPAYRSRRSRA